MLIKVIYKNDCHQSVRYISEERFDEKTMTKVEEDSEEKKKKYSSNMRDILQSKHAPGMFMKSSSEPSMMHKGKLDEGAVENMIDAGLEGAKTRMDNRAKKFGAPFVKRKNRKLRRKKR